MGFLLAQEAKKDPRATPTAEPSTATVLSAREVQVRGVGENQFSEKTQKFAYEIRVDHMTGSTLYITNTGSIAVVSGPRNFEIRTISFPDGTRRVVRFNPQTGQTWMANWDDKNKVCNWAYLSDAEELAPSDYDLQVAAASNNTFWATRLDRRTGKAWDLAGVKWVAIGEPK